MKWEKNLLEKFDQLATLEPTEDWTRVVMLRVGESRRSGKDRSGARLVFLAILFLVLVNVISLTRSCLKERSLENANNLKKIEAAYLITSNSPKY